MSVTHIIYSTITLSPVRKDSCIRMFVGERGAKTALAAMVRKGKSEAGQHAVISWADYNEKINDEVEVMNISSRLMCKIRRSDLGTCVDPSTDLYHSM